MTVLPGSHSIVYRISEGEGWRGSVPGRLVTGPGPSRSSGEGDVSRPLVVGGLYDGAVGCTGVVTGHGPRVVGQSSGGEVGGQGPGPLEERAVVVVKVGGRDQVGGVEGLVEDVTVLVMAVVEVVHVVDVSQATGVVQSGGRAGGTGLFEPRKLLLISREVRSEDQYAEFQFLFVVFSLTFEDIKL